MNPRIKGFSLIELLVVVSIIGVLASIAIPQYTEFVAKGRRALAKTTLQQQVQFMERYYTQNGRYTTDVAGTTFVTLTPSSEVTDFYTFSFVSASTNAQAFVIQAAPQGAQANDRCGTMSISHTGIKSISGAASGVTVTQCW